MRTHRTAVQKLLYANVSRCTKCGNHTKRLHPILDANVSFFFSRYSHCIRCGTPDVYRLTKQDRIDSVSRHPASLLLALTGAPFNSCSAVAGRLPTQLIQNRIPPLPQSGTRDDCGNGLLP